MNEHPRLEDIFRQIKCPKEFQDTVDKILTVENRKIIAKEEKFCFFGTGRTNDFPSEVILFLIFQSKKYPRFCCMAQDYIILGFSADKRNVYKAELEHDFSTDKDKLEICSNYTDSEDGEDSLLNALDGNEDEVYEFKVAFAYLCEECEAMQVDLNEEWIPECFDLLFVVAGAGDQFGGLLGYDSYEGDYFGINCMDAWAEDEAKKKLKQLTKDELIAAIRQSFKVYQSYIGLSVRYDSLKAAIDILRDKNTGILQVVKEIERLYEAASSEQGIYAEYSKAWKEFDQYTESLPPEAWVS